MNEGIPLKKVGSQNHIAMRESGNKETLHIWLSHREYNSDGEEMSTMESVWLSREDAKNLVEEINKRLGLCWVKY